MDLSSDDTDSDSDSDYCMELREFANDKKDLFNAERKIQQEQELEQQRRQYQKEEERADDSAFNLLNEAPDVKREWRKNIMY